MAASEANRHDYIERPLSYFIGALCNGATGLHGDRKMLTWIWRGDLELDVLIFW